MEDPRKVSKPFKRGKSWKHCVQYQIGAHVFSCCVNSALHLLHGAAKIYGAFLCVQSRSATNIFSVSSLQRWTLTPPHCCLTEIKLSTSLFFSRELHKEVDNTATISFYTEDCAQVNSMGLLFRLTNRQEHTAHLWDSRRPLHPIVDMTNENKYPIKLAFVCAVLQERGICLDLSSCWG